MAANLRRGNLPTADTMARFLYYIIKQLDVRGVDWTEVAENMEITNGHAARMRYARYKNQVEGIAPKPRESRAPGTKQKGPGRPVKKQKVEKKEEDVDGNVKKEKSDDTPKLTRVKREGSDAETEGSVEGSRVAGVGKGSLGPGAGVKREYSDVDADGEETGTDNLNPMDLTTRNHSSASQHQPQSRKGSVRVKSEPTEDGSSPRRTSNTAAPTEATAKTDAPGESIDPSYLLTMSLSQQHKWASPQTTQAQPTSAQSPHTASPHLHISQPAEQQPSPNIPFTMQHLQLNHNHSATQPPAPYQLSSNNGVQSHGYVSAYPTPAYFTQKPTQGQSPATTNSSAAFSLPPSPSNNGGFGQEMVGYKMGQNGMGGGFGMEVGMQNGMMMDQGGFVGMLEDPSFPRQEGQFFGGGGNGYGGWEGMY